MIRGCKIITGIDGGMSRRDIIAVRISDSKARSRRKSRQEEMTGVCSRDGGGMGSRLCATVSCASLPAVDQSGRKEMWWWWISGGASHNRSGEERGREIEFWLILVMKIQKNSWWDCYLSWVFVDFDSREWREIREKLFVGLGRNCDLMEKIRVKNYL